MVSDKKTIGITRANAAALSYLVEVGKFGSELDAAKFAMSYAISNGVKTGSAESAETKWNVGTVDSDGSLRSLMEALFPGEAESYRLIEHLMNVGIKMLSDALNGKDDFYDILFPNQ